MNDAAPQTPKALSLDELRFRYEAIKWALVVAGAIISFYVIDLGKLRLEEFRVRAENQRALLQSYMGATETVQPDVWKRKLRVLQSFSDDPKIGAWAKRELAHIENFAAQDALYRETLKVASQLVSPGTLKDPQREAIRARYEQLYWADLPFVKESQAVIETMVNFRRALVYAEANPNNAEAWQKLGELLLKLADALQSSLPKEPGADAG